MAECDLESSLKVPSKKTWTTCSNVMLAHALHVFCVKTNVTNGFIAPR